MEREQRALLQAEKELKIPGKVVTPRDYFREFLGDQIPSNLSDMTRI